MLKYDNFIGRPNIDLVEGTYARNKNKWIYFVLRSIFTTFVADKKNNYETA